MPAGLPVDRAGRPTSLPAANGSFLFGENLNSDFHPVLWQSFSELWGLFSDQINLILMCFNPLLSL